MKFIVTVMLILFLSGCGTVLKYNQLEYDHTNSIDQTVLILDILGMFLATLPGLIGYIIDYNTGALFLPADVGD